MKEDTVYRESEWFVPRAGPRRLRVLIGLLFLPYTGMVLSFSVIGSVMARVVHWDRLIAIVVIYFFGLGVAAHALDALGSKGLKPWGAVFTHFQLWCMAIVSLLVAYSIAAYYMILYVPLLLTMALSEGFFVFAYNFEWFGGRFHTDNWFAFSWGFLPVLSGHIMQTNGLSFQALVMALAAALFAMVEIKASRPYKELKGQGKALKEGERAVLSRYETILKSVSLGVILLGVGLLIWRLMA